MSCILKGTKQKYDTIQCDTRISTAFVTIHDSLKTQQQQRQWCTTNIKESTEEQKTEENGTRVPEGK
jgi:hypothetical protein